MHILMAVVGWGCGLYCVYQYDAPNALLMWAAIWFSALGAAHATVDGYERSKKNDKKGELLERTRL